MILHIENIVRFVFEVGRIECAEINTILKLENAFKISINELFDFES